jgi:tetratricopeptide (TPR) repeat protein
MCSASRSLTIAAVLTSWTARARVAAAIRTLVALLTSAVALAALLTSATAAAQETKGWATTQAAELTRQGKEHAANGDVDTAARRFVDAIALDGTYAPAYLALGNLREAGGDAREAERAYSLGIDHVPGFADGYVARAQLRRRHRRLAEALADLEAARALRPDDPAILGDLTSAFIEASALPAALAVARRLEALADDSGSARALAEARQKVRALAILVGEVDPVVAGVSQRGAVRRALALRAMSRTPAAAPPVARPAARAP